MAYRQRDMNATHTRKERNAMISTEHTDLLHADVIDMDCDGCISEANALGMLTTDMIVGWLEVQDNADDTLMAINAGYPARDMLAAFMQDMR